MKTTKFSLILAGLALTTGLVVSSCQKKTTTTTPPPATNNSTTSATDNNMAQQHSQDMTNFGSQGMDNGTLSTYKLANGSTGESILSGVSGSVSVTVVGSKKITVTFASFVGYDGHTRNGTIFYDWTNSINNATWYRDSGLILNITTPLNDYTVDNYTVQVNSKQVKNIGRINGQLTWTDNSNITVKKPATAGSGTIQWQGNWSMALLNTSAYSYTTFDGTTNTYSYPGVFNGYGGTLVNCIDWNHAIVGILGAFSGTASDGSTYTGNISAGSPLIANFNCTPYGSKYLYVSGTLNFTPTGQATRTINYGTGICDLTYVVSIGSYSVTITI